VGVASIIFLLAVFLILAALLGTLATGLVRILGLGILALFAAIVINMAASGRLPNVTFRNPFSPSAQQIPTTAETASPPAANFGTAQPPSANGGQTGTAGSTTGGTTGGTTGSTAGGTTGGTSASFNTVPGGTAATGANANTTGGTRATNTSQPTSTRPGVPALW
jgi:hypothetical protein